MSASVGTKQPKISKLNAGQRQLDEAIQLWIEGRDVLAVHTLTMAAFSIFYALRNNVVQGDPLEEYLSRRGHKEFRAFANFLKHADRDPDNSSEEPSLLEHEHRIGFALLLYRELTGELTPRMGAFHLMSLMTYPENFRVAIDPDSDIEIGAQWAARLARDSVEMRRTQVQVYLTAIGKGIVPANAGVRRKPNAIAS